jgi:hypothetical protein
MYSQYVFQSDALPEKNIVASLYHHYGCWSERFGYSIYNDTLRAIDSRCFKTANDDLGFTQNNFWAKCILQNPTDADLHYYLETALPITDLAEYIIDQVSGKISKAISGDALPF